MGTTTSAFLRHLRTLAARQANGLLSDQQLLERFRKDRSEASFAALVQRHGPMVLSVCRRVLRHTQDAEDAFQATFLILARKAGSIRKPESLGSWLHGVAYHSAECLRAKIECRTVHERRVSPLPPGDALDDITWRELRSVLDEELQRLPEKYRAPLVLCYLEARTQDEAARQLGWSKNTFARRMNQARQMLARRLTLRGLTLPAALTAPLLIDGTATAAVPPLLVASTVRAGLASVLGNTISGMVSAQAASLAESGVASLLAKKASIALVLLAVLTLGIGGLLAHRAIPSRTFADAPVAPKTPQPAPPTPPAHNASKEQTIEIKGRVLSPDGKPLADARLLLRSGDAAKKPDVSVRATTDKEGLFRFKAHAADFGPQGKTTLAAAAQGFGPDWIEVTAKNKDDITLRLVKDDIPIEGRVLDLEGQPIAGVTVEVHGLTRKAKDEDLTSWLEQHAKRGYFAWGNGLQSVRPELFEIPVTATTSADGKLRLSGFGRERILRLKIHGPTIEHRVFWVMTRQGPAKGLRPGDYGFYAATFDMVVGPAKPIAGTVRDKNTGKPLAGIAIEEGRGPDRAITDKAGRYRLLGVAKRSAYNLTAGGGEGRPYFDVTKFNVADSPGLDPLSVDFELERGIEVTGRLTDRVTGQPVRGAIHYFTPPDNPNLKRYTTLNASVRISHWGEARADGSFTVLTVPGPGVLVACLEEGGDCFALIDATRELHKMNILSSPVDPAYAMVRINSDEKNPQSLRCDIALEPGRSLSGTIVDPDGQPLTGVHCAGLSAPRFFFAPVGVPRPGSQGLKSARFTARSLDLHRSRAVVCFHPERKLGKVARLHGDEKTPFRVQLEALGAVSGRIVDANGKPMAGVQVTARVHGRLPVKNEALSTDLFESGLAERLTVRTTTDRAGKFRIEGLLPGMPYVLGLSTKSGDKKSDEKAPVIELMDLPEAESGKIKELGDRKIP